MLKIEQLSYQIGSFQILNNIDFEANEGKLISIVGSNGAGKSTLMKAIAGDLIPDHGEVYWKGKKLSEWNIEQLATERAILTQKSNMSQDFLSKEVVLMGRYPHFKFKEGSRDKKYVAQAMRKNQVIQHKDRNYNTLSGGEQQRVQLSRALAQVFESLNGQANQHCRLLMLDEPLNNLDVKHQHACFEMAREFTAHGNIVLMVVHDINLAAIYSDELLLLNKGKQLDFGNPEEVLTVENLEACYDLPVTIAQHPFHNCPSVYFGQPKSQLTTIYN